MNGMVDEWMNELVLSKRVYVIVYGGWMGG